jgi:hypothetical protein
MIFDLKGSLNGRVTKFNKKWWLKEKGHKKCMKDLNLLEVNKDLK